MYMYMYMTIAELLNRMFGHLWSKMCTTNYKYGYVSYSYAISMVYS